MLISHHNRVLLERLMILMMKMNRVIMSSKSVPHYLKQKREQLQQLVKLVHIAEQLLFHTLNLPLSFCKRPLITGIH